MRGRPEPFIDSENPDPDRLLDALTRRGFVRSAALTAATGLLAACGGDDSGSSTETTAKSTKKAANGQKIGITLPVINDYTVNLVTGVAQAVAGAGYGFIGYSANFKPAVEPSNFDKLIQKKVAGIIVLPVTPNSAVRGVLAAEKAGIPVVNVAWSSKTPVDDKYVGRVTLDGINGGELTAQWLKDNATPGEICLIEGLRGNESSDQIRQGIMQGVAKLGAPWKIVGSAEGGFTRDGAVKSIESLTTAHPKCKIFFDFAAEMGAGIAAWRQRNDRSDLLTISADGNREMIPLIQEGKWWNADKYVSSGESGLLGGQLLLKYLDSKQKSGVVTPVHTVIIDKTNIDATLKKYPLFYDKYTSQAKAL